MASKASIGVRASGIVFVLSHALHVVATRSHRAAIGKRGRKLIGLSADLRENLVNARASHGDRKVYLKEKELSDLSQASLDYAARITAIKAGTSASLDLNDIAFAKAKDTYNAAIEDANHELGQVQGALNGLDGHASALGL